MIELVKVNRSFEGTVRFYKHQSTETKTPMNFSIYLPDIAASESQTERIPVIYWLSGLTCTENNFMEKAGALSSLSKNNVAIVCPDTSPRGDHVPDEAESWDFGKGAGFYLDATAAPWNENYRMYSYITKELIPLIADNFPVDPKRSGITGHSMGGHGAITIALKNPDLFQSVSAFAPICNPVACPWGKKAFSNYLNDSAEAKAYDSTELAKSLEVALPILIDQGSEDEFLKSGQLLPERLVEACKDSKIDLEYRLQDGYDHSYYFISSFIENHIKFHLSHF